MGAFDEAVGRLADLAGADPQFAIADEQERWRLYEESLHHVSRRVLVLEAVRHDANGLLVSAVVVRALELVPDDQRSRWVEIVPDGKQRDFAARRARELGLVEQLAGESGKQVRESDVRAWSPWLQLRVAGQVTNTAVLALLTEHGATRRIRNLAQHRLGSPGSSSGSGTRS